MTANDSENAQKNLFFFFFKEIANLNYLGAGAGRVELSLILKKKIKNWENPENREIQLNSVNRFKKLIQLQIFVKTLCSKKCGSVTKD